jgi:allantoate deiminase
MTPATIPPDKPACDPGEISDLDRPAGACPRTRETPVNLMQPVRERPRSAGETVMARIEELARHSSDHHGLTRLYLTPSHKAAALQVLVWMEQAGLRAHIDAVGNVVGRLEGASPGLPALILGSHIDTVRNAGKYDGNLGVIVAIQAVQILAQSGATLPYAIEIIAFGDEEGVRFPVTLTGSRCVAGVLDPAALDVEDDEGISIREALQDFGCNPFDIPAVPRARERMLGYVEVHIEQGPVLEEKNLPVGVVTAISGATRLSVTVEGFAGHAGTVPMAMRRDAGAAAAEMALALEALALSSPDVVATVGRMTLEPGAVNVIPSKATFTVDLRSPSDAARQAALTDMRRNFQAIAAKRQVGVAIEAFYDEAAAVCAPALMEGLEAAIRANGVEPLRLPSGAGHDGLAMAALCPFAMLFVRCKGGISHNPAEAITEADAGMAVAVLTRFLADFQPVTSTARQEQKP